MIYLDTNVLVYAFCKNIDDKSQKAAAQKLLKDAIKSQELLLSELSLYEFAFVCDKLEESKSAIDENLKFLSSYVKTANIHIKVLDFIAKSDSHKHSFDSFHIVFANHFACEKLTTFDRGFKKFEKFSKTKIEIA